MVCGRIVRKRREKFVALTGTGWPSHAKRTHQLHDDYARKTLYAYMPCAGLLGVEYVDQVVVRYFAGSYGRGLQAFVTDRNNVWCPKWIRRNYEVSNRDEAQPGLDETPPEAPSVEASKVEVDAGLEVGGHEQAAATTDTVLGRTSEPTLVFDADGEPGANDGGGGDGDTGDPERVENHETDYMRHWKDPARPSWQLHSELGPNVDAEGKFKSCEAVPGDAGLVNPAPSDEVRYDRHWREFDFTKVRATWVRLSSELPDADDDQLERESLHDDYQQLFICIVMGHVEYLLQCACNGVQAEPLRLFLLGTAGSGKTRAVRTLLQEIRRRLLRGGLAADVKVVEVVRVAAPTGSAAFNIRFNATTIHRLIHWFRPSHFSELKGDVEIDRLQKHLQNLQLLVLDEISMVGRQMMGRIDSRLCQGKGGRNPGEHDLGGVSCVAVGDPAQCEAICDQQLYDTAPHKRTSSDADATAVRLSNRGLKVYSAFVNVVVLTTCHRLVKIDNPSTDEERTFNDRAERFVQLLRRLRDLEWTAEDYFWLCKRKASQLALPDRKKFAGAPVLMDFRRATHDNPDENCEAYNRKFLRTMARHDRVPVVRFAARYDGVSEAEGAAM